MWTQAMARSRSLTVIVYAVRKVSRQSVMFRVASCTVIFRRFVSKRGQESGATDHDARQSVGR